MGCLVGCYSARYTNQYIHFAKFRMSVQPSDKPVIANNRLVVEFEIDLTLQKLLGGNKYSFWLSFVVA